MFTKEQKKEAYKKLSEEERDFALSNDTIENITKIAHKHGLNAEQADILDTEVYHTMIGLINYQELKVELNEQLKIEEEKIQKIMSDLKEALFDSLETIRVTKPRVSPSKNVGPGTVLPQGDHLIEDSAGNKDNTLPPIPQNTALEKKLGPIINGLPEVDVDWQKRKQTLGEHKVVTDYKGSDPYREPLQ